MIMWITKLVQPNEEGKSYHDDWCYFFNGHDAIVCLGSEIHSIGYLLFLVNEILDF